MTRYVKLGRRRSGSGHQLPGNLDPEANVYAVEAARLHPDRLPPWDGSISFANPIGGS